MLPSCEAVIHLQIQGLLVCAPVGQCKRVRQVGGSGWRGRDPIGVEGCRAGRTRRLDSSTQEETRPLSHFPLTLDTGGVEEEKS